MIITTKGIFAGRGPYMHGNKDEVFKHSYPCIDGAAKQSVRTIVQHTSHFPDIKLHIVRHRGYVLSALVAIWDVYNYDKLLLKYTENEDGS